MEIYSERLDILLNVKLGRILISGRPEKKGLESESRS